MTDLGFTEDDIRQLTASRRAKDVRTNSGYKAIQPYLNTIPAFTEDDVRQYVLTHGFSGNITSVEELKLEKIVYTTREDVYSVIASLGSGEKEQMVFLAELSGIFEFSGGPPPRINDTFHTLFVVFDAQTGNVITTSYRR